MEPTYRLSTPDVDFPTNFPSGEMQRFPESCQRSSLVLQPESKCNRDTNDSTPYVYSWDGVRESSPSERFYHAHRSRRASESSTDSGDSSFSHLSHSESPSMSTQCHLANSGEPPLALRSHLSSFPQRSTSAFDTPCELPALSDDGDTVSSRSSEGPQSPSGPWYGLGTSLEPPELSERILPLAYAHPSPSPPPSPAHPRSPSLDLSSADFEASKDLDKHSTFSKVVVTKFSNPPRYRLKKVKFHQCPMCQKSFPRPSGLRTHMNMHTNTKPYACPYEGCDKSFSVISNAKRHYRTHLVDLPPDQMGLPSGPYTVNFSDPVIVPDSPASPEAYFSSSCSSSATSSSRHKSSLSTSSTSSLDDSDYAPNGSATKRRRASERPGVGEDDGAEDEGGRSERRQSRKARNLRWLPLGSESRWPWKANSTPPSQTR